jgi:CxxC motif-containing protein
MIKVTEKKEDDKESVKEITCIVCPRGCRAKVRICGGKIIEIEEAKCKRGRDYLAQEAVDPKRILFTTVPIDGAKYIRVLPVRSDKPFPKGMLKEGFEELSKMRVKAPVKPGEILVENILGTGINIKACRGVRAR